MMDGPQISQTELFSLVRHSKYTLLKEALDYLPNKDFDKSLVKVHPFLSAFPHLSSGSLYRRLWHLIHRRLREAALSCQ
jgi:hypothetical protein